MNTSTTKKISALVGAGILASGAAGFIAAVPEQGFADTEASHATASATNGSASEGYVQVPNAQGVFSYGQDVVTPNAEIASMFRQAASAICSSLPDYEAGDAGSWLLTLGSANGEESLSYQDLEDGSQTTTTIAGCACSANMPGGGAIANAEVGGVSVADIYERTTR